MVALRFFFSRGSRPIGAGIRRIVFFKRQYSTAHLDSLIQEIPLTRFLLVRAQKSLGLVNGTPEYNPVGGFVAPDVPARTQSYSADGRLYAYALPTA